MLAAHRGKIKTVIIPADNERDLREIPDNVKAELEIRPVRWIDQVLEIALEYQPIPVSDDLIANPGHASGVDDNDANKDEMPVNTH